MHAICLKALSPSLSKGVDGHRRTELEMIQRAVMAADEIYVKEGLEVKEADMVNEVNAALEESRESGAKLDMEQLKEQAFSVLKVS